MDKIQENKNSNFQGLGEFFNINELIVTQLPVGGVLLGEFRANCNSINDLASRQLVNRSGLRDNKEMLRDANIVACLDIASRIFAFATMQENATLIKEAKYNESELRKMADTRLVAKITALIALAEKHAPELVVYGVTATSIANLVAANEAYATAIPQPKLGIDENKQITSELNRYIKANDAILRKMDALAELQKASNPVYYASYRNLRKVVQFGKGSLAMTGSVLDADTQEGIQKVKIGIEMANEDGKTPKAGSELMKNVKFTSPKGNFDIRTMPEGRYLLTVSKLGYITQVMSVNVVAGEMCRVVVNLVKE
jgi:hypothetical protein